MAAVAEANVHPLGYEQITDLSAAVGLTIPDGAASEVQTVTLTGFSGTDSFKVTFGGEESATAVTRGTNFTAAGIKTVIESITGFAGTVTVYGISDAGFTVRFGGAYANTDVGDLSITSASGCSGTVATTIAGYGPPGSLVPRKALIVVETQPVRFRDDGVAPTATVGMKLASGDSIWYTGELSALSFIQTAASASLSVSYYA